MLSPHEALDRLREGNERYVAGTHRFGSGTDATRRDLRRGTLHDGPRDSDAVVCGKVSRGKTEPIGVDVKSGGKSTTREPDDAGTFWPIWEPPQIGVL